MSIVARLAARLTPRPPEIREARSDAAGPVATVHAASFHRGWGETEFERLLADPAIITHTAHHVGRFAGRWNRPVIGFVMSRCAADEAEILSVAVVPSGRGRGLGRRLIAHHMARLAGRGIRHLFLEVEESNAAAIALYRRAGFVEVGRRRAYYGRPGEPAADALVMRRDLA